MPIDRRGLPAPRLPGVFEVANQFLVLGIHTDDRLPSRPTRLLLALNIAKLRVALGVLRPCLLLLGIDPQGISVLFQQPTHEGAQKFFHLIFSLFRATLFFPCSSTSTRPRRADARLGIPWRCSVLFC